MTRHATASSVLSIVILCLNALAVVFSLLMMSVVTHELDSKSEHVGILFVWVFGGPGLFIEFLLLATTIGLVYLRAKVAKWVRVGSLLLVVVAILLMMTAFGCILRYF